MLLYVNYISVKLEKIFNFLKNRKEMLQILK